MTTPKGIPIDNLRKVQGMLIGDPRFTEAAEWLQQVLMAAGNDSVMSMAMVSPGSMPDHFRNACLLVLVDRALRGTTEELMEPIVAGVESPRDRVKLAVQEIDDVGGMTLNVEAVGDVPGMARELYLVLQRPH